MGRVYPNLFPRSKRCIYCPLQKRRCPVDHLCPCPWRNSKWEVAEVIERFRSKNPPKFITHREIFHQ